MSVAFSFLLAALVCAAITFVLYAALENDPAPSVSGYLPLLIFFGGATLCLFLASVVSWIVSITIAVLT